MEITVAKDGTGEHDNIQSAVNIAKSGDIIRVKAGVYSERVEITKPGIFIIGEGAENTVLRYGMCAKMKTENGEKLGTFRSYTMLVFTHDFTCRAMTIANTAGFGSEVGQAVAVYAEGDRIAFEDCRLLGHQDTLFTGPLPPKEIEPGGFRGPTEFAERKQGRQLYKNCYIEGEVDFIFGSAAAYFEGCELFSLDRGEEINGFVTAASTPDGEKYGYVFDGCRFTSNCPDNTVYIGRPWREYAKTVLINCEIGGHIRAEGFHDWGKKDAHDTVLYAVHNCKRNKEEFIPKSDFARTLSPEEVGSYTRNNVIGF